MTLLETVVMLAVDVLLGIWLGSVVFFSFIGAPTTFDVLGDDAGAVIDTLFPRYSTFGAVLGFTALNIVVVVQSEEMLDSSSSLLIAPLLLVALFATIYAQVVLVPKMKRANGGFTQYNKQSIVLNGVTILSVTGGLVCSHF